MAIIAPFQMAWQFRGETDLDITTEVVDDQGDPQVGPTLLPLSAMQGAGWVRVTNPNDVEITISGFTLQWTAPITDLQAIGLPVSLQPGASAVVSFLATFSGNQTHEQIALADGGGETNV